MNCSYKKILILFSLLFLSTAFNLFADVEYADFKAKLERKAYSIEDCFFKIDIWAVEGKKEEQKLINYYFKSEKNIRMEVVDSIKDSDRGSVAVTTGNGKVKGRRGGWLKYLTITFKRTNKMVTSVRGIPVDETNPPAFVELVNFYEKTGSVVLSEFDTYYRLECRTDNPEDNYKCDYEILDVDKDLMLPVYSESYIGSRLIQKVRLYDYGLNTGLPGKLFTDMHYGTQQLHEDGFCSLFDTKIAQSE